MKRLATVVTAISLALGCHPTATTPETLTQATPGQGKLAIRLVVSAAAHVQALSGAIASVSIKISGRNVPTTTPPFVVTRAQFTNNQAQVTIGSLLPGPIKVDVSLLDSAGLVLGSASGTATITAGLSTPVTLSIDPNLATASIVIAPISLGEPTPAPAPLAISLKGVPDKSWAPGPPLSVARAGLTAGTIRGRIYATAGDANLTLETLDPAVGAWVAILLPPLGELKMSNPGSAVVRDQIVVLGGNNETSGPIAEQVGPVYIDPFGPPGGMVRTIATGNRALPESGQTFWRTAAGVAAIGDLVYLAGGVSQRLDLISAPGGNGWSHPPITEILDVAAGQWRLAAPIPTPRGGLGMAALGGKLIAVGGYRWNPATAGLTEATQKLPFADAVLATLETLATVEVYDPATDDWSAAPSLPTSRHSLAVAVAGGRIYAIGGVDANRQFTAALESWAPGEAVWTAEAPMPTARALLAATTATDGLIAVMGGLGAGLTPLKTVELYNPGTRP